MLLKCNFCDPVLTKEMRLNGLKNSKSINTETDQYVKDEKNKYYHVECYVQHLMKRKKMGEMEARDKLNVQLEKVQKELKEMEDKDRFYKWIMNFYDTALPAYFCTKISEIISGQYEKVNEPIPYTTLLDIYEMMATFLNKNAFNKSFKNKGQRMNYDLAVVLGKYGDYKSYKERMKNEQDKVEITKEALDDQNKINHVLKKKNEQDDEGFNLSDVLEDILL
ncbi:hypothetical protein [Bacillus xiapuensis]|uniref:Phage protein n=1 Tax=Bacillus xiapuensis TaxID=2014075 RepID=A0ABU6N932_9BACI|nr:hypothetical protein [Bacillus xiapuensis]